MSTNTESGAYMIGTDVNSTRKNCYEDGSDGSTFNYGSNTNVPVKNHISNIGDCSNQLQGCSFTKDQYDQILHMLKQNQGWGQKSEDTNTVHDLQANTVSKTLLVSENNKVWIIDTGASNHMDIDTGESNHMDMLTKHSVVKVKDPKPVYLPTGEVSYVSNTGVCHISPRSVITNVYHIPEFKIFTLDHSLVASEKKLEVQQLSEKEVDVWHRRLGHGASHVLSKVFPVNSEIIKKVLNECTNCPSAKQTRTVFPISCIKSSQVFDLIHLDLWGPYKQPTFDERGIVHQRSCPYTPQQNGVAERKHRHLLEVTRALRFQGHIPLKYWGQYVLATVYLINRMPSRVLGGKSPYEKMYGSKPMLSHLRVLGCLCYVKVLTESDKLASRTKAAVHMGYSETQKGYILLDLTSSNFFVSRDLVFKETVFPFMSALGKREEGTFVSSMDEEQCSQELNRNLDGNIEQETVKETVQDNESVSTDSQTVVNRRSTRGVHPPVWMKDFVSLNMGKQVKYPIADSVAYNHLSKSYQEFVAATSILTEPTSFAEASKDPKWIKAMQAEIQALQDNKTWKLVDLPKGKSAIGYRWIYKIKTSLMEK
ncbi:uncharacterized protein LOC125837561 [Solanum verrucosum]|uniref:uncharacterized protein LOC125837561 n=1 Tax=Solanum verrucosum TaxID=315347 RepID=UPI0020D1E9B9|nr:uncharacterized protein LOC125837561 [Solanum verrucosum]